MKLLLILYFWLSENRKSTLSSIILLIFSASGNAIEKSPLIVASPIEKTAFKLQGFETTRVDFQNIVSVGAASENQILLNGSGVTASDFDNDGLVDLFFAGLESSNILYKNHGDFVFMDVTPNALRCANHHCTAAVFADINADNWQDVVIGTIGKGVLLFINNQEGGFTQLNYGSNIPRDCAIYGIAISDLGNDGDLDMYISTYRSDSIRNNKNIKFEFMNINGQNAIKSAVDTRNGTKFNADRFYLNKKGHIFESGPSDYIIINENNTGYNAVKSSKFLNIIDDGQNLDLNWGLGCIFADLNNDLSDDLYICNDLEGGDFLILNDGGTYQNGRHLVRNNSPMFSMGVDVADVNNDGLSDIFICDMLSHALIARKKQTLRYPYISYSKKKPFLSLENNRNMLFVGDSGEYFDEIAYYSGLESSNWSWCPIFLDVDLDGYQDLFVTNGFGYDLENIDLVEDAEQGNAYNSGYLIKFNKNNFDEKYVKNERNLAFKNNGNLTFTNKEKDWGLDFNGISHGACLADLDNDGDEDIVINNFSLYSELDQFGNNAAGRLYYSDSKAAIYQNNCDKPRVRIRISGYPGNPKGIGAIVKFKQSGQTQTKQIRAGSRYCSSDEPAVTFSIEEEKANEMLVFLNGKKSKIQNLRPGYLYTLKEGDFSDFLEKNKLKNKKNEIFEIMGHTEIFHYPMETPTHINNAEHVNKDVYLNEPVIAIIETGRIGETVPMFNGGNIVDFNVRATIREDKNNEVGRLYDFFTLKHKNIVYLFELRNGIADEGQFYCNIVVKEYQSINKNLKVIKNFSISGFYRCFNWKPSGIKERIDLIVGGGPKLNNYPSGYDTLMIPYDLLQSKFLAGESKIIARRLMVNDIHIVDSNDGQTCDIILAAEASYIHYLRCDNANKITDISSTLGLRQLTGFWNSISSGDLNGDGKLDFLCGNASLNTMYNRYSKQGYSLVFNARKQDPIYHESFIWNSKAYLMQNLNEFKGLNPLLGFQYTSNSAFSETGIDGIFTSKMSSVSITNLENLVIMSGENGYSVEIIDDKTNYLPIYGSSIDDFNLDGKMDVYVCQGYPAYKNDVEPNFNYSGLFLLQDKAGEFVSYKGHEMGLSRDMFSPRCILAHDLNNDNKPEIIIGDYGKSYMTYINRSKNKAFKLGIIGDDVSIFGAKIKIKYDSGDTGPLYVYTPRKGYRTATTPQFCLGYEKNRKVVGLNVQINNNEQYIPVKPNVYRYTLELNSF